jgi:hypothetical protein
LSDGTYKIDENQPFSSIDIGYAIGISSMTTIFAYKMFFAALSVVALQVGIE